eukprot:CAMPEP_0201521798 /NCGR_PEP_ID=MMETSP0161_2-20130828/16279_1 /ASSEMBLY_ACC=CAM_ASM_000251 /TAXON_ID=180227 /ORGANISM="Neoparamoeba aestuarina, Strain SoJaBio B1-5/56/2" /LENGTH=218 /DNA_ID=CAMNT_0047920509 /DNA_START=51 /DNA_END=707 /DNA_ORIENTATION=-
MPKVARRNCRITNLQVSPLFPLITKRLISGNASETLGKAIQKEIEDEKKLEAKPSPTLPENWSMSHTPKNGYFTMCKPETETTPLLEVFCALPKSAQDNNDEPIEQYPFILRMCRNNRTVEYSMVSVDSELVVGNIMIYSEIRKLDDFLDAKTSRILEGRYQGPTLAHLDENLIAALHEYLEELQINDKFAQLIKEQCEFIEQKEYELWLSELKAFSA